MQRASVAPSRDMPALTKTSSTSPALTALIRPAPSESDKAERTFSAPGSSNRKASTAELSNTFTMPVGPPLFCLCFAAAIHQQLVDNGMARALIRGHDPLGFVEHLSSGFHHQGIVAKSNHDFIPGLDVMCLAPLYRKGNPTLIVYLTGDCQGNPTLIVYLTGDCLHIPYIIHFRGSPVNFTVGRRRRRRNAGRISQRHRVASRRCWQGAS